MAVAIPGTAVATSSGMSSVRWDIAGGATMGVAAADAERGSGVVEAVEGLVAAALAVVMMIG